MVVGSNGYKMGLKKIQFDDLNFDGNYSAWNAYNQSKLAQMMFGYELQRRVQAAGTTVQVQVCHPGMSRTELNQVDVTLLNKILFRLMSPLAQPQRDRGPKSCAQPRTGCSPGRSTAHAARRDGRAHRRMPA